MRPLIGYPEWYNGNSTDKNAIGKCFSVTNNPQFDCFFYELGVLFIASIYLCSGVAFWLSVALIDIIKRTRFASSIAKNSKDKLKICKAFLWPEPHIIVV